MADLSLECGHLEEELQLVRVKRQSQETMLKTYKADLENQKKELKRREARQCYIKAAISKDEALLEHNLRIAEEAAGKRRKVRETMRQVEEACKSFQARAHSSMNALENLSAQHEELQTAILEAQKKAIVAEQQLQRASNRQDEHGLQLETLRHALKNLSGQKANLQASILEENEALGEMRNLRAITNEDRVAELSIEIGNRCTASNQRIQKKWQAMETSKHNATKKEDEKFLQLVQFKPNASELTSEPHQPEEIISTRRHSPRQPIKKVSSSFQRKSSMQSFIKQRPTTKELPTAENDTITTVTRSRRQRNRRRIRKTQPSPQHSASDRGEFDLFAED